VILRGHDFRLLRPPAEPMARGALLARLTVRRSIGPAKREAGAYVPLRTHSHYFLPGFDAVPGGDRQTCQRTRRAGGGLTDIGNLHGAVEFVQGGKGTRRKADPGGWICGLGDKSLLLYVESGRGYENLCRLLSRRARAEGFAEG